MARDVPRAQIEEGIENDTTTSHAGVTGMPRVYAMQVVWFETSLLCG